jgi:hypothetical protein
VHSHFLYIFVVFSYFIHYNKRKRTGKTNLKRIRPGVREALPGVKVKERKSMEVLYKSTRGNGETVTASQAILKGLSDDGGLFVPTSIPALDVPMEKLAAMSYQEVAYEVMSRFLTDFTEDELKNCIANAYDAKFDTEEIAPLTKADGVYYLELFHGATIAFKDMALSILPHLMTTAAKKNGVKNEMRQNGKCHVLERDRCAVEQLQIVNTVCFCQRCNFLCVKFCIVCVCNTVFQFIFCKVGKKTAHYLVCHFLIAHSRKFFHGNIQCWNGGRYK